jgi:ATP-dependent Lhr-like helicase
LHQFVADPPLATHLLSATLSNPDEIAARYTSDCEVITVSGQRSIDYHLLHSDAAIRDLARARDWKKLLYFCNRRASVEQVAADLADLWKPYPVVAHHGSLDRKEREEAEKVMKEARVAICVATSTMEIGIDIGDIDLVVLAEPPWSIASLLQRVGRGNRRAERIQVAALVSSSDEQALLETMFETAAQGTLAGEPYVPDLSVAVQQTLSFLFQKRSGIGEAELFDLLAPLCTEAEARKMVNHLVRKQWIQRVGSMWYPDTKLLDEGEQGRIHSNVPDHGTFKVVSVETGQEIGTISGMIDEVFLLAGRSWQVVSIGYGVLQVRKFSGKATATSFSSQRDTGGFHALLPPELR